MQPITHSVVFPRVMENPSICSRFLKLILTEGDYPDIENLTEENIVVEKNVIRVNHKDTRFDVYIHTQRQRLEMEMQNENRKEYHTPNRSKFYHVQMAWTQLEKKVTYDKLMPTTVIFLCMFDYFNMNHPRYTFRMNCEEYPDLNLGDGTCTMILNLKYEGAELKDDLKELYAYFRNGTYSEDNSLVSDIHKEVVRVNLDEEEAIMTWEDEMELEVRFRVKEILEQAQGELEQAQGELEQAQGELEQTQGELEQTQGELEQTQGELEQTQGELEQTQGELEQTQGELEQTQGELEQTQGKLEQTQEELKQAQGKLYQAENDSIEYETKIIREMAKRGFPIESISEIVGKPVDSIKKIIA